MKITVSIQETLERLIDVEANSAEEAVKKVKKMYDAEEIVLDSSNMMGTKFKIFKI